MIKKIFSVLITLKIIFKYFIGFGAVQKFHKRAFRKKDKLIFNFEKCDKCFRCVNVCPLKSITFDEQIQKIVINEDECVHCGFCAEECKTKALKLDFEN